jgi:glycosyltransferase involved in cell wall biosynthesis
VVPAYNEQEVLPEFHRRISKVFDSLGVSCEVIYVNDGSRDRTADILREIRHGDTRVTIIELSRNFGKEAAMTAGLDHARGDAVVVIDADLQDPPELIPELVKHSKEGFVTVYAKRTARAGETWFRKASAAAFYRLIQRVSRVRIPMDTGDFRLLSRRAVNALGQLREQHRFMKGLFAWIGFSQKAVPYRRDPRFAGETKWSLLKRWNFAMGGSSSFTNAPLKIATYLGLLVAFLSFVYAAWVISKTLMYGDPARGYPSLMVVILFLGGAQLAAIGIVGEYLGNMLNETKRRPLYFIDSFEPASSPPPPGPE